MVATQIAVARRITGERDVSDVMLCGMLRMPLELHLADDAFGPPQLQSRMLEAADELEKRADRIAELERENEALKSSWEPIETAPKDGTEILLLGPPRSHGARQYANGFWCRQCWVWPYIYSNPTHWMSLPEPPSIDAAPKKHRKC